jgi:hypothetical protein
MKKTLCVFFGVCLTTTSIAQDVGQNGFTAASRSAHETLWQLVEWQVDQRGQAVARTNEFVELATSLNYFDETTQQFLPSREEWVPYPDGIVALAGRHKVILAPANLTLGGPVVE